MGPLQQLVFGKRNLIGRRLIVYIVAFSSLITLCISVVQLSLEYRELRSEVDEVLESVGIHVPSLSNSVWDFDEKQIQLILGALAQLPHIERIDVTPSNTDKTRWTAGKIASARTVARSYTLRHLDRGRDTVIGTLEVTAGLDGIYHQILSRALTIVLSNGIKTFLVALFMIVLFRRLVTLRLERMGEKVAALLSNTDGLPQFSPGTRPPLPGHLDELDAVDWTLDRTAEQLGRAVETLRELNEELQATLTEKNVTLDNALVGIFMLRNGLIVTANQRLEKIFGYGSGTMDELPLSRLFPNPATHHTFVARALATLGRGLNFSDIVSLIRQDETPCWIEISGRAIDPKRVGEGSIWICSDVSERKQAEAKVEFIAFHDALTGLPNRLLAQDRLQQAMAHAERAHTRVALLVLDLDNFKTINDSLGHSIGDGVIREIAHRLVACVRDTDTVCRQGGDEFVILLPDLPDAEASAPILVNLMERLAVPCHIDGHELITSVSIGIAIYPEDGRDFDALMKKADLAMYRAKDAGRNTYRFFDAQMNVEAVEQLSLRNGLRHALVQNEFVLHYQPQIDLTRRRMVGVEALIRWNHPERGMIPPGRFIPVAEESGLIVPISEWVLREACRQAALWNAGASGGGAPLPVAVNLSAVQFKRSDIEQSVIAALEESGIDPGLLELELTESILISDTESVLHAVQRLKQLGVKLSIDDFGTGYSSLSYLKRFAVDKLKIDQSFVRDLATDPEDSAIVRAIIQMAHSLNLTTIAEGIETAETLALLESYGCDEAQGYFFARPMPAQDILAFRKRLEEGTS